MLFSLSLSIVPQCLSPFAFRSAVFEEIAETISVVSGLEIILALKWVCSEVLCNIHLNNTDRNNLQEWKNKKRREEPPDRKSVG